MNWQLAGLIGFVGVAVLGVKTFTQRQLLPDNDAEKTKSIFADIGLLLILASFPLLWVIPEITDSTPFFTKALKVLIHGVRFAAFFYCAFNFRMLTHVRLIDPRIVKSRIGRQ